MYEQRYIKIFFITIFNIISLAPCISVNIYYILQDNVKYVESLWSFIFLLYQLGLYLSYIFFEYRLLYYNTCVIYCYIIVGVFYFVRDAKLMLLTFIPVLLITIDKRKFPKMTTKYKRRPYVKTSPV
jgi:hypothetical protein